MTPVVPITDHPALPDEVPLVADFNDDRNRLSYYYPLLKSIDGVRTPITSFHDVDGTLNSYPQIEYRDITTFMIDQSMRNAFVRGDYSSGKYDGDTGSKITSQDPYDIEDTVLDMFQQLSKSKRNIGGRIAVREWIPHDIEARCFLRDGEVYSGASLTDLEPDWPMDQVESVAEKFNTFAWSCDFIRHEQTHKWYCIDMGLDGLYYNGDDWVAISEHHYDGDSPEQAKEEMPTMERLRTRYR